jgi:DNA-binding response OmpR family regulator
VKVLLTLQDVEPAVRINALLERDGIETALVSPLDDIRGALKREKPDIIVFTADLGDPATVAIVKEQLWNGAAVVGLSDAGSPTKSSTDCAASSSDAASSASRD